MRSTNSRGYVPFSDQSMIGSVRDPSLKKEPIILGADFEKVRKRYFDAYFPQTSPSTESPDVGNEGGPVIRKLVRSWNSTDFRDDFASSPGSISIRCSSTMYCINADRDKKDRAGFRAWHSAPRSTRILKLRTNGPPSRKRCAACTPSIRRISNRSRFCDIMPRVWEYSLTRSQKIR
jgi:hypothetical protein